MKIKLKIFSDAIIIDYSCTERRHDNVANKTEFVEIQNTKICKSKDEVLALIETLIDIENGVPILKEKIYE